MGATSLMVGIIIAPFIVQNIENPLYRSIVWGFFIPLVIIIALSIGLMPYWGMREIKIDVEKELSKLNDVYKRDTTRLPLIVEEKNNTNRYLLSRFAHLYLRNAREVELEIEWFNGTLFEVEFGITSGIVKIGNLECKVSSVDKRSCNHGSFCNYTVSIPDNDILQIIRDSISYSQTKPVDLFVVLNTEAKVTYEYDGKPESTRAILVQCSFDHKSIIPLKI